MRLPSMPPSAAPASVPTARLPAAPPMALPMSAPAPAPTRVPPTSLGPESVEQAASAAPSNATTSSRTGDFRIIALPGIDSLRLLPRLLPSSQTPRASSRYVKAAIGAKLRPPTRAFLADASLCPRWQIVIQAASLAEARMKSCDSTENSPRHLRAPAIRRPDRTRHAALNQAHPHNPRR